MTDAVYRKAFEQARRDLDEAMDRRNRAQKEAEAAQHESLQLRRTVAALAALCGEDVEDSMGLTEAVRLIFQTQPNFKSVKETREQVEALGVSLADLKNADASVTSVLNRLTAANELEQATRKFRPTPNSPPSLVKVWRKPIPEQEPEPMPDDDIPF